MKRGSLRFRLIASWLIFILLTLNVAGFGLVFLFERSMARRTLNELNQDLQQLARGIEPESGGSLRLTEVPADPHFSIVYSGRYWQIAEGDQILWKSPSLWGDNLALHTPPEGAEGVELWLPGPQDQKLFGVARTFSLGDGQPRRLNLIAAADYAEITTSRVQFAYELWIALGGLAVLQILTAAVHVSLGLRPLEELRNRLGAVRNNRARRLEGRFPLEVLPLVAETNGLLDAQEKALEVARTRSANLAHGLKTPLAVMAAQSRSLRRRGENEAADEIDRQVDAMRRHVERELARTRARGGETLHARINPASAIREIASAVQQTAERDFLWQIDVPESLQLIIERSDFDDIMGNLLENASKWAKTRILVQGRLANGHVWLSVEDDGPGVADDQIERVIQRGERVERSVPGTGLGLAIVSDIVSLYRGRLELMRSSLGGLKSAVWLPHD